MRNKTYNLKEIINPSRTYIYNSILNILTGVFIDLIGVIVLALFEVIFSGSETTDEISVLLHICAVICAVPFFIWSAFIYIRIYRIGKIMKYGKCYEGKIVSFSMYGVYIGTEIPRLHRQRQIILNIEYSMKKTHYCKASGFWRNPNKVLSSKICNVYLYNGMYFVTGFSVCGRKEPKVFIPRE